MYAVGAIFASAGVADADLVLVVKPGLIEFCASGVENPAAEPEPYSG